MMVMSVKKCIVCNAEFTPAARNNEKRQICCSPECSKEREKQLTKERQNTDKYKKRAKELYKKRSKNHTVCRLCGKPTVTGSTGWKSHYHDECILDDCSRTIESGRKLTKAQYNRMYTRGYTIDDLRECVNDD